MSKSQENAYELNTFDVSNVNFIPNFEGLGPAVEFAVTGPLGTVDAVEWFDGNGHVETTDSNCRSNGLFDDVFYRNEFGRNASPYAEILAAVDTKISEIDRETARAARAQEV